MKTLIKVIWFIVLISTIACNGRPLREVIGEAFQRKMDADKKELQDFVKKNNAH